MCDFLSGYKLSSTLAGCPSVLPLGTSCRMTLCRSTLSLHPAPILPLVTVTTPNGYALPSRPYNWESFHLIVISEHSSVMAFPAAVLVYRTLNFGLSYSDNLVLVLVFSVLCPHTAGDKHLSVCCRGSLPAFTPSFRLGLTLSAFSYIF